MAYAIIAWSLAIVSNSYIALPRAQPLTTLAVPLSCDLRRTAYLRRSSAAPRTSAHMAQQKPAKLSADETRRTPQFSFQEWSEAQIGGDDPKRIVKLVAIALGVLPYPIILLSLLTKES